MITMIERVAKAIFPHLMDDANLDECVKADCLFRAKAAIEALRIPNAIMISAGDTELPYSRGTETHRMAGGVTPEQIWTAMVEAALCDHNWQENTEDEDVCLKCDASREPNTGSYAK